MRGVRRGAKCACSSLPGLDAQETAHLRAALASRADRNRHPSDDPLTTGGMPSGAETGPTPIEVDTHLVYGFHYALGCLRQDRPLLFWAGIAGLLYLAIRTVTVLLAELPG